MARLTDSQPRLVQIIARHDGTSSTKDLPSAQNLAAFCFPLGPEHVTPREYAAPEVSFRSLPPHAQSWTPSCRYKPVASSLGWAGRCIVIGHLACLPMRVVLMQHAGVLLHIDSRRWEQAPWLLQVRAHLSYRTNSQHVASMVISSVCGAQELPATQGTAEQHPTLPASAMHHQQQHVLHLILQGAAFHLAVTWPCA